MFITAIVREQRPRSHHKGATGRVAPLWCDLATNGFQFYAIANLDKWGEKENFIWPVRQKQPSKLMTCRKGDEKVMSKSGCSGP